MLVDHHYPLLGCLCLQTLGDSFFGNGTREEYGTISLEAAKSYRILVRFGTMPTSKLKMLGATDFGAGGVRIGGTRKINGKIEIEKAVQLAKEVDQVVICAGLNGNWESEGYDRPDMDLPGLTDELIYKVAAANPRTAVVIQSGTPVTMRWRDSVPALVQAWYGGNETGNAVADVLFGDVNPSGKLPLSFPIRNEDNPAFLNYRSERGRTIYGEDVYIGYRYYEKTCKAVAFPFGHGLSYTEFEMTDLDVVDEGNDEVVVSIRLVNKGRLDGAQVVQVYVRQESPSENRPPKELKGFTKVLLKAGEERKVEVCLRKKYAASFWDEERDSWIMEKDRFEVLVGDSSADTPLRGKYFEVQKTQWWKGL